MSRRRVRMALLESVRAALAAMLAQKLRSALTLLGVVAGVATVIMMVSFVAGFDARVTAAFTSFGTHLVQFQKWEPRFGGPGAVPEEERNRRDLTLEDAEALKRLSKYARAVSPERYLFGGTVVKAGGAEANQPIVFGAGPDYPEANAHFVQDGRFFTEADVRHAASVTVIGTEVADALFRLRDPIGQEIRVGGRPYRVIGLFERKGSFLGGSADNFVSIPISTFDEQFPEVKNGGGDTIHIATVPKRPEDFDALVEEETAIIRARRGLKSNEPNDFAVWTSAGRLRDFRQISAGVAAVMLVLAAIALLVGGVGVMNIMLVNVTQRTREIGIRRAVGATRRDIGLQFLLEAVTLTAVGGAIGVGCGLGAAFAARALFDFRAAAPAWSVALGFGVASAVGLVFGLWPAVRAARQDPIDALRYE